MQFRPHPIHDIGLEIRRHDWVPLIDQVDVLACEGPVEIYIERRTMINALVLHTLIFVWPVLTEISCSDGLLLLGCQGRSRMILIGAYHFDNELIYSTAKKLLINFQ